MLVTLHRAAALLSGVLLLNVSPGLGSEEKILGYGTKFGTDLVQDSGKVIGKTFNRGTDLNLLPDIFSGNIKVGLEIFNSILQCYQGWEHRLGF